MCGRGGYICVCVCVYRFFWCVCIHVCMLVYICFLCVWLFMCLPVCVCMHVFFTCRPVYVCVCVCNLLPNTQTQIPNTGVQLPNILKPLTEALRVIIYIINNPKCTNIFSEVITEVISKPKCTERVSLSLSLSLLYSRSKYIADAGRKATGDCRVAQQMALGRPPAVRLPRRTFDPKSWMYRQVSTLCYLCEQK